MKEIEVNEDGLAVQKHRAKTRFGNGELTLCGQYIDHATWKGEVPEAEPCAVCESLDA